MIGEVEPRAPHPMPADLVQKWVDCQNIGTSSSENVSIESSNKNSTDNGLSKESTPIDDTENQIDNSSDGETHSTNLFTSKRSSGYILSQTRHRGAKKLYTATDSPVELSSNASSVKERTTKNINENTVTMKNDTPRGSPAFRQRIFRFSSDTRRSNFTVCTLESNSQCSTIQLIKYPNLRKHFHFDKLYTNKLSNSIQSLIYVLFLSESNLAMSDNGISCRTICSKPLPDDILNQVTPKTTQSKLSTKLKSNSKQSMGLNLFDTSLQLKDDNPVSKPFRSKSLLPSNINNSNSQSTKKTLKRSFPNEPRSIEDGKNPDSSCSPGETTLSSSKSEKPQPKKYFEKTFTDRSNKQLLTNGANRSAKLSSNKSSFKKEETTRHEKRQRSNGITAASELKNETEKRATKSRYKRTKKRIGESTKQSSEENLLDVQHSTMKMENERKFCMFSSSDSESDNFRHRQTKIKKTGVHVKRSTQLESQFSSESEDETTGWDLRGFLENNKTSRKSMISMYR